MKRRGDSSGAVDEVEADFGDDARLARRWKRRHMTAKIGRVEKYSSRNLKKARSSLNNKNSLVISELVTVVEEDYLIYLNDLTQLSKFNGDDHPVAPFLNNVDVDHDGYGDDEDSGGGVTDPEYAMFLDNVEEVGKSYMLEYVMADGKRLVVKYEEEDGSKTGNHFRSFEANGIENKENNRQNLSKHSKKYGFKDPTDVPIGKMDMEQANKNQRVLRSDLRREERENQIEVFKSSTLERKNAEKSKKIVGGDSRRVKMEIPRRTLRSGSKKETDKSSSVLRDTVKKETIETGRRTLENMSKKESMRNEEKLRNARTKGKGRPEVVKNVKVKEEGPVISPKRKRGRPKKIPDTKTAHSVKRRCTHTVKSDFVDEVYQEYLSYYKHEGRFLVYAPEGGKRVVYERDSDSDSDSEVLILENDPYLDGDHTPLLIDLAGDGDNTVISGSKDSQYRKKLMEILQQPFDETEYDNLSKEASCRRPMEQERNLRGRTVSCRLKGLGKSYLAQFTGKFCKKLKQVRHDPVRRLNLLRGFFYYLEHASHEGKFKPWNDPSCSSILPPVSPTQIKAKCEV